MFKSDSIAMGLGKLAVTNGVWVFFLLFGIQRLALEGMMSRVNESPLTSLWFHVQFPCLAGSFLSIFYDCLFFSTGSVRVGSIFSFSLHLDINIPRLT